MLFPESVLFDFVLIDLKEEMASRSAAPMIPMRCDRWIARSALQKAVRRGDNDIAQRALANLFLQDRTATWRHLVVIALEDVGVANVDILDRIVAARLNKKWRLDAGGDWAVMSELVRQMAESDHCQAACDLLMAATNLPELVVERDWAFAADVDELENRVRVGAGDIRLEALAVLALSGGLGDEHPHRFPCRAFHSLGEGGHASHIVMTCQAAWRATRNPMALLLPLVWRRWMQGANYPVQSDQIPAAHMIKDVPSYAIDQFTRVGLQALRDYLSSDPEMLTLLDEANVPAGQRVRTVGDLLFLAEGSALARRVIWPEAEVLRHPFRPLQRAEQLGDLLANGFNLIAAKLATIDDLCRQHLISGASKAG